jgi:hypothetical protein
MVVLGWGGGGVGVWTFDRIHKLNSASIMAAHKALVAMVAVVGASIVETAAAVAVAAAGQCVHPATCTPPTGLTHAQLARCSFFVT